MNYTYKKTPTPSRGPENTIIRKEDNAAIPFDESNNDYQEYLEWVAAGNTAEAAD